MFFENKDMGNNVSFSSGSIENTIVIEEGAKDENGFIVKRNGIEAKYYDLINSSNDIVFDGNKEQIERICRFTIDWLDTKPIDLHFVNWEDSNQSKVIYCIQRHSANKGTYISIYDNDLSLIVEGLYQWPIQVSGSLILIEVKNTNFHINNCNFINHEGLVYGQSKKSVSIPKNNALDWPKRFDDLGVYAPNLFKVDLSNEEYGLLEIHTGKKVILSDGIEKFDEIKSFSLFRDEGCSVCQSSFLSAKSIMVVRVGNKCNVILVYPTGGESIAMSNKEKQITPTVKSRTNDAWPKYLHYLSDDWMGSVADLNGIHIHIEVEDLLSIQKLKLEI